MNTKYAIDPALTKRHVGHRYPGLTITATTRIMRAAWRVQHANEVAALLETLERHPLRSMRHSTTGYTAALLVAALGMVCLAIWFAGAA